MPVCRSWRRAAQHRQSPIQASPHSCTYRLQRTTCVKPSGCLSTYHAPAARDSIPSDLAFSSPGGTVTLRYRCEDRPLLLAAGCCCSPPPTCPPVRARSFPCCCVPVPLRPRASQQRDISTCICTCSCPCTSTCHSPTPARLRHFLECRRIRADVCGVDEWRGLSTSRAP